jgi:hypothetical protein
LQLFWSALAVTLQSATVAPERRDKVGIDRRPSLACNTILRG